MQAPFPYFGGKSKVAALCWERFGRDVAHYVEPFFGSGAVLLASPYAPTMQTVNDADCYVANFWRAVAAEPDAVADMMNWPVNEDDLEARHKWLVTAARKREHGDRMRDEPDYFDVKIAAWWCWGLCAWIGSGWCGGEWHGRGNDASHGCGTHGEECAKRPNLGPVQGVHRKAPNLGDAGVGECARRGDVLREWMRQLADRLRNVRVCCGDWSRICASPSTTDKYGMCAVFLDPPYSGEAGRDNDIYRVENLTVAHDVREWCKSRGVSRTMRIALCGYEGEHEELESCGWECVAWKTQGGFANVQENRGAGNVNKHRERIWFSPACVATGLFTTGATK